MITGTADLDLGKLRWTEIRDQQNDDRHKGGVNEQVRRCPCVARESRRSARRADPHQRSGEVKGVMHAAEDRALAEKSDRPAERKGRGDDPDPIENDAGKAKEQSAEKKNIVKINEQEKMKRLEGRLVKNRVQPEI